MTALPNEQLGCTSSHNLSGKDQLAARHHRIFPAATPSIKAASFAIFMIYIDN
jgi:hypothetical protein